MTPSSDRQAPLRILIGTLALFALWEYVGHTTEWGRFILPPPDRILAQFWTDRELYWLHGLSTLRSAGLGFLIGTAAALLAAFVFCLSPALELAFRGLNIAIFAMPAIVIGPLLVIFFQGNWPQIILAALMVYFPAMSTCLLGLKEVDPRLADLVAVYGGGPGKLMRHVRLRGALPSLLAGLRVAAPLAVLGAVLGEFGSGARWGFGTFLLAALPQGIPARLWGIGIATSLIALAGFVAFLLPARRLASSTSAVTMAAARPTLPSPGDRWRVWTLALVAAVLPFALWSLGLWLTGINPIVAPGPLRTLDFVLDGGWRDLFAALGQTLPMAGLGLLAGLAFAFVLAALSILAPTLARALLPVAMVLQNMPLVALVPFVVLMFGRGVTASVFMAVLVVFFPAYVLLNQGFSTIPRAANDLVQVYGGGRMKQLVHVAIPYSISYLFAAARLVAPQALLGVMVAEWLLSGIGLGNLLNMARARLDYEMVWAGAVVSIVISVAVYEIVGALERRVRV
ncbi:ABC transporter permease [Maritimibacter alkaliphilus]|uniref:ABC transporter permease n=1 Tax=Maritimibacter alkaliphilus TaxID=404236 RepID=UPI001C94A2C6|nr:ABC transporter permease subunit [Maritimibacter alkaliphilus]MBY6092111.1 ABC transporter permease subunit [Maritimibacter alkaliphilus]